MKTPLSYQVSEYDCGPTTLLNAVNYLFDREQIYPDLIKYIQSYCMDGINDGGEIGKGGTSRMAMKFLASWLNQYRCMRKLPIYCESLNSKEVYLGPDSRIVHCIAHGGCAVVRVDLGGGHYVLLTGVENDRVCLFDPYFRDKPFRCREIEAVDGSPFRLNRKVSFDIMNSESKRYYAFGKPEKRECVLLYNTKSCVKCENRSM
jgi:hypothetical protein